ncbi:MAG: RagB/SusD family nutrient uptake outer membrane protein [Dyadobacter sp.]|uniref:RagB/SusD family nutrient uptake outer membrane protein n=1 Tax=Dyadobacter sp. TaxID=1914288 RepID=UPI001B1C1C41|nr:RagB/SusD family nutrient uptake outer membrane protein [Dyadobacter sp.]MBO9616544.1 RagB/SusD family nutrient uptake outer membrane protein [Dyadobacter sp.]
MKIKNKLAAAMLFAGACMAGCSDSFLDRPPLSQISADNFYQTTNDLRLATAALYGGKPWAEWNYTCYLPIGEVLSGNMAVNYWGDAVQLHTFSVSGSNEIMIASWKSMYKIIAHCNVTIKAIQEKAPASIPEKDRNAAIAEAKFLRAYAYYNLALQWRDVPIIEDNTKLINAPLVYRNTVEDVYRFAANDLLFAAEHLPAKDAGRVSTWSAQGMLAKVYLTWAGLDAKGNGPRNQALLDSAKLHAGNVCKQSGLSLLPNYADLFKTQFNDNQESLFALQWAAGAGWLEGNMLQIYSPGGAEISAAGQAGWFAISPTYDLYKQYQVGDSLRRKATFMLKGDYYPELNAAGGGYKFNGNTGLKKHIIGTRVDNSAPTMSLTSSTEHNALLRLAEVYLIYAEAVMGNNPSTTNADALLYFNKVRTRAGLAPVTSLDAETLFRERRVELAAEGHFWEDLVRLSYYNEPKAIKKLNEQERILFTYDDKGVVTKGDALAAITPANTTTFKFPIPSPEVTANPKLLEAPVPYSF